MHASLYTRLRFRPAAGLLLIALACGGASGLAQPRPVRVLQVPGAAQYCRIDTAGVSVLPSGRHVTPAGRTIRITRAPFGLKATPDGRKAVVLHHNGVVTVVDLQRPGRAVRLPGHGGAVPSLLDGAAFLGVDFTTDSRTAFLSGGDKGTVVLLDMATHRKQGEIRLDVPPYKDSFTSDLVYNAGRNELLILDRANFRLVRYSLGQGRITASIPVGRIPFGIALSPDKKHCLVANAGLYAYPAAPGLTPASKDGLLLAFPPYGVPSGEAENGVEVNGRKVPGLGSPHVPEAMSVWVVDLAANRVTAKLKTGLRIGQMVEGNEIVGGASPNSIAVGNRFAYVTNATNDNVSVIDYRAGRLAGTIPLRADPRIDRYRGLMPFGICLSKDENTLYVALLGFNAVAVADTRTRRTLGLIPTGWGTTRVVLSPDEQTLLITSARGHGAGPNGGRGFVKPPQGTYIGDIQLGTLQMVPIAQTRGEALRRHTRQVVDNTFRETESADDGRNPLPPLPGLRQSPIRHVVYITKENRTYDEVLGQLKAGNGDSTLARFGVAPIPAAQGAGTVPEGRAVAIMPNHLKIARQFAFSDNFYCDSDASIHGHHWMTGQLPNEYVEANAASEGRFDPFSPAPGRRFPKATGGVDPEDYNEIGGLWENLARHNAGFYNFGEANEFAGVREEAFDTVFGAAQPVVFPLQKVLFDRTSRAYAGYNTNIPDQLRVAQFEAEFTRLWLSGKDTLPALVAVQLPNDHGAGIRPADGYPYPHSFMADNDLALGRMLAFLSRTPYWKNMLVIITEDDPQGGLDHVDAHRSVLLMAGPYVKRGHASHTHANFGSVLKVIYHILDLGYVNQYDATASLLQDFFTDRPDYTPYQAERPDTRVFDPETALKKYGRTFDWRKVPASAEMDAETDQRREHYRQNPK